MSEAYLRRLLDSAGDPRTDVDVTLDLQAAERAAAHQRISYSRHGVRSRQGDPYEVAAKCQAAAEAFDALEEWLRLPDASQDEIQAAVLDFRQAQELAAQAIQEANAQASARGLWADERHAADALDASGEAHAAT